MYNNGNKGFIPLKFPSVAQYLHNLKEDEFVMHNLYVLRQDV